MHIQVVAMVHLEDNRGGKTVCAQQEATGSDLPFAGSSFSILVCSEPQIVRQGQARSDHMNA